MSEAKEAKKVHSNIAAAFEANDDVAGSLMVYEHIKQHRGFLEKPMGQIVLTTGIAAVATATGLWIYHKYIAS